MKSGWHTSTLGDLLAVLRNGINCKQDKSGRGCKISRIESIADACFDLDKVGYAELSERDKERYRLQSGDILFSHINSAAHVGKTATFDSNEEVYHGVNLLLMRPSEVVTSAYLEHALKFLFQSGYWRRVCKQSINQASVNQQDVSRAQISYPRSLDEQRRIVEIIDKASEGIAIAKTNAERNLQNARAILESHLQSIFGMRGDGWVDRRLANTCLGFTDGDWIESKDQAPQGIRLVQTGNIGVGEFKERGEKARYVSEATFKRLRCTEVVKGDCLISRLPNPVGRSCVLPETGERMITAVDCTIVRFDPSQVLPRFFVYFSQSQDYLRSVKSATTGTTRERISRANLGDIAIPVAPLADQARIITRLDGIAAETEHLASLFDSKRASLDALTKSLLYQALGGEL